MTPKVILLALLLITQYIFKDVSQQVGLTFQHYNGMTGKFYLPEITGSGAALFDFDNDGDNYLYRVTCSNRILGPTTRSFRGLV